MRVRILATLLLALPLVAIALPRAGETLPPVQAPDVEGTERDLQAILRNAHGKTLLVAITDRGAGDAMQAWFDRADAHGVKQNRVSIISIDVPFYISDDYARSKARGKVPEQWRSRSLMDTDKKMAKKLGMESSKTPYVLVLQPDGKVVASVHAGAESPEAETIWRALEH